MNYKLLPLDNKQILATHLKLDNLLTYCQTLLRVSDSCPTLETV